MSLPTSQFNHNDYEMIERKIICQAHFTRLSRYTLRFKLFGGGWSEIATREIVERRPAVGVLLYDPEVDQVILIEQFRPGALANPEGPWLIEIVAGVLEGEDDPAVTARRESKEEAGADTLDLYLINAYFVSPGASTEYFYTFCGRVDAVNADGIYGLLTEENEDIRAFAIPSEEAFKLVRSGQIKTGPAIIALQWLQINREWLKESWLTKKSPS